MFMRLINSTFSFLPPNPWEITAKSFYHKPLSNYILMLSVLSSDNGQCLRDSPKKKKKSKLKMFSKEKAKVILEKLCSKTNNNFLLFCVIQMIGRKN